MKDAAFQTSLGETGLRVSRIGLARRRWGGRRTSTSVMAPISAARAEVFLGSYWERRRHLV
jgi:hypothetical protein